MNFLILQTFFLLSKSAQSVIIDPDLQEQLSLFQRITGINATEAQYIWNKIDQGILTNRKRRSTRSNMQPKFRLEITEVSLERSIQLDGIKE